jgi:hypothetical protein
VVPVRFCQFLPTCSKANADHRASIRGSICDFRVVEA